MGTGTKPQITNRLIKEDFYEEKIIIAVIISGYVRCIVRGPVALQYIISVSQA
jgi:hypothetical protein